MKFLEDIKNQSQGTREVMFGLSVFITVLLVGFVWFHSFQRNLYVLLNPEDGLEKALAVDSAPVPSLFGFIWQTAGDLKGFVSSVFAGSSDEIIKSEKVKFESGKIHTLPLSEKK